MVFSEARLIMIHEWIFAAIFVLLRFLVFTHSLNQWTEHFPRENEFRVRYRDQCKRVGCSFATLTLTVANIHVVVGFTTSKIEFYIRCSCIRTQIGCYVFISLPNEPYGSTFRVHFSRLRFFFATWHKSHFKRQMARAEPFFTIRLYHYFGIMNILLKIRGDV